MNLDRDLRMARASKIQSLLYKLGILVLGAVGVFILVLIGWLVYPYRTLEITAPVVITNEPVAAGNLVHYRVSQCRYTELIAHTERKLVSDSRAVAKGNDGTQTTPKIFTRLASAEGSAPRGCRTFEPVPILIPDSVLPGIYHIEFEAHFKVNPIRTIKVEFSSNTFEVGPIK